MKSQTLQYFQKKKDDSELVNPCKVLQNWNKLNCISIAIIITFKEVKVITITIDNI